jgi:hypothetical protein
MGLRDELVLKRAPDRDHRKRPRDHGPVRNKGILLVVGGALVTAIGVVVFLAQRPPTQPPLPKYAVARIAEVSTTPLRVEVVMRKGADRLLQRERSDLGRCPGNLGCPSSTEMGPVPVFLVRDESGALHAFIGADPRNGCALEWMTLRPEPDPRSGWFIDGVRVDAVFHDVCHGSLYDRRGQVVGGPSPWNLNELATEVRGRDLYVDPGTIVVGECRGCPRSRSNQGEEGG